MRSLLITAALAATAAAQAAPTEQQCETRVNDTPALLGECIQQNVLWSHLADFQAIADAHPDAQGHGNRDTFTAGYKASVDYVAKLMRAAGYTVTVQSYTIGAADQPAEIGRRGARAWPARAAASGTDYNLIADSPSGDPDHVFVVDGHLDSIYGAGMLDNASGSVTVLETALALAKTPTKNHLRFIWFGGEEIGLFGSQYYTRHLTADERKKIIFDLDVDVTATPNFDLLTADASKAGNAKKFPPNVLPGSAPYNQQFLDAFAHAGAVARSAPFGSDGTDSNNFGLIGIPNTGVLTNQDCCKRAWETKLWGGYLGDYEGKVPGYGGQCVDTPNRWCDTLSNNDPFVLELVSKVTAQIILKFANDPTLGQPASP